MAEVEVIKAVEGPILRKRDYEGKPLVITRQRVAAYVRVSTDDEEQLESFQSQKKYYQEKISENRDWVMVGIYADVYNQRLIPFDTKKAVQTPKITAFESKNADRKPLFLFYEAMMSGCWIHQCTRQMGGGCICTQAK